MITITPFNELGRFGNGWLDAHYHFSFAGYHDPTRMGLGPLRVWNDDTIEPHTGFDPHPHRDMEIVTYVRSGAISHEDSLGNKGVTRAGDVQVMHAGTGIVHSEYNHQDEPTTLFQIWILPDTKGHGAGWQARQFPKEPVTDSLPVLASGRPADTDGEALPIHQDAAVLGGRLGAGTTITHVLGAGRGAYLVPTDGAIEINGRRADRRAGVSISGEETLILTAIEDAEVVMVEVAL